MAKGHPVTFLSSTRPGWLHRRLLLSQSTSPAERARGLRADSALAFEECPGVERPFAVYYTSAAAAAAAVGVVDVRVAAAVHIEDGGVGGVSEVEHHPAHSAALESDRAAPAFSRAFRHVLMQPPAPPPRPPCVLQAMPVVTSLSVALRNFYAAFLQFVLDTCRVQPEEGANAGAGTPTGGRMIQGSTSCRRCALFPSDAATPSANASFRGFLSCVSACC